MTSPDGNIPVDGRTSKEPVGTAPRATRRSAIRIGVVLCVAIAGCVSAGRLDNAIAVFDFRADVNDAATFRDRTYLDSPWVAGEWTVMDDARLWMPKDATYRVVQGPFLDRAAHSGQGPDFLRGLLLPRRETNSKSARWVFCYDCDESTLGSGFEVLSKSRDGFLFARVRS